LKQAAKDHDAEQGQVRGHPANCGVGEQMQYGSEQQGHKKSIL
jgi:hypothetical protein